MKRQKLPARSQTSRATNCATPRHICRDFAYQYIITKNPVFVKSYSRNLVKIVMQRPKDGAEEDYIVHASVRGCIFNLRRRALTILFQSFAKFSNIYLPSFITVKEIIN